MNSKTTLVLTVTLIAGATLLVAGMSVEMAYAAANQGAPGQNGGLQHNNPSGGAPPPGQVPLGNSGQCIKAGFPKGTGPLDCMPK